MFRILFRVAPSTVQMFLYSIDNVLDFVQCRAILRSYGPCGRDIGVEQHQTWLGRDGARVELCEDCKAHGVVEGSKVRRRAKSVLNILRASQSL